jgi:hypothetical protein
MSSRPMDFIYPGLIAALALRSAVELRLPELLRAGPRNAAELAADCGADAPSLERLLRALSTIGVFQHEPDGRYRNSPNSDLFRTDHPLSLRNMALCLPAPYMWQALGVMPEAIRAGKPAFNMAHGESFFDYISARPEESDVFNQLMAQEITWITPQLIRAYDFTGFKRLVDVGGGAGAFLKAILTTAPNLDGILFDQPHVAAKVQEQLSDPLAARIRVVGGSFFESVPEGGDLYTLKRILHDWSDEDAIRILTNIRRAIQPEGTLVILEALIDSPTQPAGLGDLMMLVLGGRERTKADFRSLLTSTRFTLQRTLPIGSYTLLEARPI